jgi:hypothetical protein
VVGRQISTLCTTPHGGTVSKFVIHAPLSKIRCVNFRNITTALQYHATTCKHYVSFLQCPSSTCCNPFSNVTSALQYHATACKHYVIYGVSAPITTASRYHATVT